MAALSQTPFNTNAYGVQVRPMDFSVADAPTTQMYHGASIVANGNIIGRITNFNDSGAYTRAGVHVYEVSHKTWGHPVDYVPGKVEGFKFALARAEVWSQELEITLGFDAVFDNLTDQNRPFSIQEYIFKGNDIYRVWQYTGCWFTTKNPNAMEAEGDGIIRVESEVAYVSRIRIQG